MRAPLCLHAGHWKAAAEAVATIASWRRIPAPLAWMVEARLHLVGVQATWPMLAELAWLSPRRLDDRARRSPDPLFAQWIRRFEARFEGAGDAGDRACPPLHAPVQPGATFAGRRWRPIANPDQMAPRCAQMSCTVAGAHCIERSAGCEPSEAHAVSAAASFSPISPGYSLAWLDCLRNSAAVCIMARLFRKKMLQRAAMNEVFV